MRVFDARAPVLSRLYHLGLPTADEDAALNEMVFGRRCLTIGLVLNSRHATEQVELCPLSSRIGVCANVRNGSKAEINTQPES